MNSSTAELPIGPTLFRNGFYPIALSKQSTSWRGGCVMWTIQ